MGEKKDIDQGVRSSTDVLVHDIHRNGRAIAVVEVKICREY